MQNNNKLKGKYLKEAKDKVLMGGNKLFIYKWIICSQKHRMIHIFYKVMSLIQTKITKNALKVKNMKFKN